MKRIIVASMIAGLLSASLCAQHTPFSAGFGLSDSAGNLGLKLELSSPSFAKDFLVVRAESQMDLLSAYRNTESIAWKQFSSHRLGLVGRGGWNSESTLLYGEFGGLLVLPPASISDDAYQWGIYGLFGFEFFMTKGKEKNISYYLEAGTNGLFDTAEKLQGKPDYYSGFAVSTGLRKYF